MENTLSILNRPMKTFWDDFYNFPAFERKEIFSRHSNNMEIRKNEDEYLVLLEVPGYEKNEIDIKIEDGHLHISGEKKKEAERKHETSYTEFKSKSKFERSVKLGTVIDTHKITADLKNGVLSVTLPFAESQKPKKIELK